MKLTPNQFETLHKLQRFALRVPRAFAHLPAVPYTVLDMRSIEALEKRGAVECIVHEGNGIAMPCYRLTDKGRQTLETGNPHDLPPSC
jgi:hypothetical protein